MADVTMRQMLEAGVHFGHQTRYWNPKMAPYIFGERNKIHIINLEKSLPMARDAYAFIKAVVADGGKTLFVGTKRAARDAIRAQAERCEMPFVSYRWLGGMLTNWRTISNSIGRLRTLDEQLASDSSGLTKKELLNLTRERERLERTLGGIREMGGLPDVIFIVDTNKEEIAKHEALKLGIPVMAVVDSNSDPAGIAYPIPGNDDATRAILMYCDLIAQAVIDGLQAEQVALGTDVGAKEDAPAEVLEDAPAAPAPAAGNGADPAPPADTPAEGAASAVPAEAAATEEAPADKADPAAEKPKDG